MFGKMIAAALATAAATAAGPALAQQGQGHGHGAGGVGVGVGVPNLGVGAQGRVGADIGVRGGIDDIGVTVREQARINSRARVNASERAIARANVNSVLSGDTVVSGPLVGLTVGTEIRANGSVAGRVERIVPMADGMVRNVLVRLNDGRIVALPPSSLMLSGDVWTAVSL